MFFNFFLLFLMGNGAENHLIKKKTKKKHFPARIYHVLLVEFPYAFHLLRCEGRKCWPTTIPILFCHFVHLYTSFRL